MEFTMDEQVMLIRALEDYAVVMDERADDERTWEDGGHPESWGKRAAEVRSLLQRIVDAPTAQHEGIRK